MNTLVIEKHALKNNIGRVKELAGSSYIYANLSGDGYGAGAAALALFLRDEGIRRFCVDSAEAAGALRKAGLVDEEILMLHSTAHRQTLEYLADRNVICTVGTVEAGMALNALAESRATVLEAHLEVDCGMGFGGFPAEEPETIVSVIRNCPNIAFSGIYTQLSSGRTMTAQAAAFAQTVSAIQSAGCETGIVHAAGSYAIVHRELPELDAVRAGSVLLGRCHRTRKDGLITVGHGEAPVDSIRWLPKGHTIGNEKKSTLRRPTRVAVLPVGYQNGLGVERIPVTFRDALRRFFTFRRRTVRVNSQKVRILGTIGATETLIDITGIKCAEGDIATFDLNPLYAKGFKREYR